MSEPPKASGVQGEHDNGLVPRHLEAEGENFNKCDFSRSDNDPPTTSGAKMVDVSCRKKTFAQKPVKGVSKENVTPSDTKENVKGAPGPSPVGGRKILQENVASASGDFEMNSSQEGLPAVPSKPDLEKKIFQLREVSHEITAEFVPPKAEGDDQDSAMDCSIETIVIHGAKSGPPKPKKDHRDNLGKFAPMLVADSVSDLWVFDEYITRSGAFIIEETENTKSYKCQERVVVPEESCDLDNDKMEDYEKVEDFLNFPSSVNALGVKICEGHFKVLKLRHQIYRIKTSSDSLCAKCQMLVPVLGLPLSAAFSIWTDNQSIEPFISEVDDKLSHYKVAWIHKRFGTLITDSYNDTLTLSKFNDCVAIAVEVFSPRGRRDTMFFPFAYLLGDDLCDADIEHFLKVVIEKCKLATCSYVITSNHHEKFAAICSRCFRDGVKVLPNFFQVIEELRKSWFGRERNISDFDNSEAFVAYMEEVRATLHQKITSSQPINVEKVLEHSLGLNYCEIANIKQIIDVVEDYVAKVIQAGLYAPEHDKLSTKEDCALTLQFLSQLDVEAKVRYLNNYSEITGNHILLMMPDLSIN